LYLAPTELSAAAELRLTARNINTTDAEMRKALAFLEISSGVSWLVSAVDAFAKGSLQSTQTYALIVAAQRS
jgi:hypothetical protein